MEKNTPPKKPVGIRYSHPGHEDFNRHLEVRQNPTPRSNWIDRPWMPSTKHTPLPNLRREFDMNRDPLIRKQMEDLSKSESERREEQTGRGSSMVEKDKSVPELRPPPDMREPKDRERFAGDWLKEQKDAAMSRAANDHSRHDPGLDYKHYPKGPSQ